MKIVNRVYKGRLQQQQLRLDLNSISLKIPDCKFYAVKPAQVVVKTKCGASCLIFSKGAIRLMGANIKNAENARQIIEKEVLHWWTNEKCPELVLQTMTVTHSLPQAINLLKFHTCVKSQYEFELFSGLRLTKYDRICANLFCSGKLVLCGIKSEDEARMIIKDIYCIYNKYIDISV
jgi:TATA-box binding protein (TBP) (component of TFIID and TFIIIB)